MSLAVSVEQVGKQFGGVSALEEVSFEVPSGSITGIIGPNGAGKSTLFNVLTNVDPPDVGSIRIGGVDVRGLPPHRVAGLGVARTFQTARAFPHLSVRDNVLVGCYLERPPGGALAEILTLRSSRRLQRQQATRAEALLETFGLSEWADASPTALPSALAKYMDLARAVMSRPGLVLLDEPAAGLNDAETGQLGEVILAIRDSGSTVMVVEHNMSLLFGVADDVVVLDAGRMILTGPPSQVRCDENVISAYFGSEDVGA